MSAEACQEGLFICTIAKRPGIYAGGSDHMLYQHITVLTPGITTSWSSVPPSFLVFIVVLVMFRGFLMVRICLKKKSKSSLRWHDSSPSLPPGKIWRFLECEEYTVQNLCTNKKVIIVHPQTRYWSPVETTLELFLTFFLKEKIQTQETGRPFVPVIYRWVSV